jgi:Protein of unknown function (DUF4238)
MNNPSVKHHYLPRHYLRGFTDDKDGFFVYDKQTDKIFKSSPGATFFENNLNTIVSPQGDASDWLEDFHTEMENKLWHSFDTIRNSTNTTPIDSLDKMNLFLFLLFLHWRLPSNIQFAEQLAEEAFNDDNKVLNFFKIRNKNGEEVSKELIEEMRNSPAFKKAFKPVLTFAPFLRDKNWGDTLDHWRFLYSADNKGWYIVGDNPIVTEGHFDHDPINCLREFVFPVSGRILLVNTHKPINKDFPPEIVIYSNNAIIERARRFVACQNKDFLEALVEQYKLFVQNGQTDLIIPQLFQILQA